MPICIAFGIDSNTYLIRIHSTVTVSYYYTLRLILGMIQTLKVVEIAVAEVVVVVVVVVVVMVVVAIH